MSHTLPRMRYTLLALGDVVLASGCASVKTTSQALPGVAPKQYHTLLVAAVTNDLQLRQQAESSFVRAGVRAGVKIIPYHAVFLPGRQYTDSEFVDELHRRDISGVLILRDATTEAPTVRRFAIAIPLCAKAVGNQCVQGTTVITGGESVSQDEFTISSQVVDVDSEEPIWVGSTKVTRNGASTGGMLKGLANDVVASLVKAGIVQASLPSP